MIAHPLSTVGHVDPVHVMEAGRVVEAGTHDEQLVHAERYAARWRVQTGAVVYDGLPG